MTTNFKGLLFAAAVAMLPVACGTSTPTGMDVAAIEADGRMSAFRGDPTLPVPPQAPEPPSPQSIPLPVEPQTGVDPVSDPPQAELPSNRPNRPAPGTDPAPAPPTGNPNDTVPTGSPTSVEIPPAPPVPSGGVIPTPPTGNPNDTVPTGSPTTAEIPAPPVSGGGVIPTPPTGNPNETVPSGAPTTAEIPVPPVSGDGTIPTPVPTSPLPVPEGCQAVSIDIFSVNTAFAEPRGATFVAVLNDADGRLVEDDSCEKLVWDVVGGVNDNRIVISHGDSNTRFAYVLGMSIGGTYKVHVITPNNLTATLVVTVK